MPDVGQVGVYGLNHCRAVVAELARVERSNSGTFAGDAEPILERQRELIAPLAQRMLTVIDGVRAERNIAVVFDVANPNSTIISADPAMDLTTLVISRLQAAGAPPQNPL